MASSVECVDVFLTWEIRSDLSVQVAAKRGATLY